MKHIGELISKHIDFHFALTLIAILGTAGSLHLQFVQADIEFETLNGSIFSNVRSQKTIDDREDTALNRQLDQLEDELNALNL